MLHTQYLLILCMNLWPYLTISDQVWYLFGISRAWRIAWNAQNRHILFYFYVNTNTKIWTCLLSKTHKTLTAFLTMKDDDSQKLVADIKDRAHRDLSIHVSQRLLFYFLVFQKLTQSFMPHFVVFDTSNFRAVFQHETRFWHHFWWFHELLHQKLCLVTFLHFRYINSTFHTNMLYITYSNGNSYRLRTQYPQVRIPSTL